MSDALDIYWSLHNEEGLPDSMRPELKKRASEGQKDLPPEGGGISPGKYGLEVYESGGEYYADARIFNLVMGRLRLEGVSSNRCRLQSERGEEN